METIATAPLLIIDDFGMRKLPHSAAEDLLETILRRYERFSTLLTSNRPVEDWGQPSRSRDLARSRQPIFGGGSVSRMPRISKRSVAA